jgi:hypothetical protein
MLGFFNRSIARHEEEIRMLKAEVEALKAMVCFHDGELIKLREEVKPRRLQFMRPGVSPPTQ